MGLYLPINAKGPVSIAVCGRCNTKMQYADLRQDPHVLVIHKDAVDLLRAGTLFGHLQEEDCSVPGWPVVCASQVLQGLQTATDERSLRRTAAQPGPAAGGVLLAWSCEIGLRLPVE